MRYYLMLFALMVTMHQPAHAIAETQGSEKDCVILLHGLIRSEAAMVKMEKHLTKAGYFVVNQGYPSRSAEIATLAPTAINTALKQCPAKARINFVTHSMGGILLRHYLGTEEIENLHRVVMLGPPNQGSQVVDKLGQVPGYKLINGPAGKQLGTKGLPPSLGAADYQLGIIAGSKTINLILSTMLPGPNDGKVTVASTKLEGMTDHLVIPVSHPFLSTNKKVMDQVTAFLQNGAFSK